LGHGLQSRRIEGVLALEVVVEQGLVDAGGLGNLLGAGAGQPVFAELMDGGVEDAGAGLVRALGLRTDWEGRVHVLTNWLVN
jgi:hypothetical protein